MRSNLTKKGLPYRELYASHPDFLARIRLIVRLGVTPILETPQGDVLQDSIEIIAFLEQRLPARPMLQATSVQRIVATLLDAYGTEHLMLPAMLFRWTERMNLAVLEDGEFPDCAPAFPSDDAIPPTLEPILAMLFSDWMPELRANGLCFEAWLAGDPDRPAATWWAWTASAACTRPWGPLNTACAMCP